MVNNTSHKIKMAMLAKTDSDYPLVVEVARKNLPKVRAHISGSLMYEYLNQWEKALSDKEQLKKLIADESSFGYDLWQINPFCGVFSQKERLRILRADG
ncbi:MAG: hypothetical protein FWD65_08080 [Coriobacteriia bacterium]|nr:hypothetical protein [Coriobacteriia bacterium]